MVDSKLDNLIGRKFGKLEVKDYHKKENGRQIICTVQCECGSEPRDIPLYLLTSGNVKSCGCTQGKGKSKKPIEGERFNQLTVLEENEKTGTAKVKCDCGTIFEIPKIRTKMASLKRDGMCKECKKRRRAKKFTDIEPRTKFNHLTVIKRVEDDEHGQAQYLCKCQCGNQITVLGKYLVKGLTKSCGCIKSTNFNKIKTLNGLTATPIGKRLYGIWASNIYNGKRINRKAKFFPEWIDLEDGFIKFYNWATTKDEPYDMKKRPYLARYDTTKDFTPDNCYFTKHRTRVVEKRKQ